MAKTVYALFGAALVLTGSFFLSLKAIDHFGLFSSGPIVSLRVEGKESLVIPFGQGYQVAYETSGAQSCEMVYHDTMNGSSGRNSLRPNTAGTAGSRLIGDYTLTCTSSTGAIASKSIRIIGKP